MRDNGRCGAKLDTHRPLFWNANTKRWKVVSVSLPDLPKEKEFEEYISAFFNQSEITLKET